VQKRENANKLDSKKLNDVSAFIEKEFITSDDVEYSTMSFEERVDRLKNAPQELLLRAIKKFYKPQNSELFRIKNWELEESFLKAVESGKPDVMQKILTEVSPNIFSFQIFKKSFCNEILKEAEHFSDWAIKNGLKVQVPNTMNNYGVILDHFGFYEVLQEFTEKFIQPLSVLLFPWVHFTRPGSGQGDPGCDSDDDVQPGMEEETTDVKTSSSLTPSLLDGHHGFLVQYAMAKDKKLDFHVDMADVTLNVCLGKEFTGGDLWFGGIRCAHHQQTKTMQTEDFTFAHKVGQGILHVGKHRHLAKPIMSGERINLILWCRNSTFKASRSGRAKDSACPPWCGVFHYEERKKKVLSLST